MRVNIHPLIKPFYTRTDPAAETESIGLPADARAPMVFATQLRKLNRDKTPPTYLDGKAKTIYALTRAATKLYRRPLAFMRSYAEKFTYQMQLLNKDRSHKC